ncbi:hypothetical protein R1sor_016968 [Riccia sorocarpa]|uniref:Uncharacterized protein n=1 Tax=Riccia sorocarpa TaxID=122646 RepID=A0ABD3I604_9MARC
MEARQVHTEPPAEGEQSITTGDNTVTVPSEQSPDEQVPTLKEIDSPTEHREELTDAETTLHEPTIEPNFELEQLEDLQPGHVEESAEEGDIPQPRRSTRPRRVPERYREYHLYNVTTVEPQTVQEALEYEGVLIRCVMGTPLPDEDDDSEVDAYSQIMSSQPYRPRSRTPVHLHPERNYGSQPRDFPANSAFLPTVGIPPTPRFLGQPQSNFYPPSFIPPSFNAAAAGPSQAVPTYIAREPVHWEFLQSGSAADRPSASADRPSTDRVEVPVRTQEVPIERQSSDRPVVAEENVPPSTAEESNVQAIPRPRNAAGKKKRGQQASSSVTRMNWDDEWVVHLLELKKIEHQEGESLSGRDVIVTADAKWKKNVAGAIDGTHNKRRHPDQAIFAR